MIYSTLVCGLFQYLLSYCFLLEQLYISDGHEAIPQPMMTLKWKAIQDSPWLPNIQSIKTLILHWLWINWCFSFAVMADENLKLVLPGVLWETQRAGTSLELFLLPGSIFMRFTKWATCGCCRHARQIPCRLYGWEAKHQPVSVLSLV